MVGERRGKRDHWEKNKQKSGQGKDERIDLAEFMLLPVLRTLNENQNYLEYFLGK
jgi:hypothetical protein